MNNKNVARYGIIGAVLLILLYLVTLIGDDSRNYAEVDTSVALQQLAEKNVEEAQIDDREQRVRLTCVSRSPLRNAKGSKRSRRSTRRGLPRIFSTRSRARRQIRTPRM